MRAMHLGIFILVGTIAAAPAAESPAVPVRTLGRVFTKLKAAQPVTIAYFGGSITAAPGYRVQLTRWFRDRFPKADVREVNAAIGGTGSDLGAFRCGVDWNQPGQVFMSDSVHPNALGHGIYTQAIVTYLNSQIDAPPAPPPNLPAPLVSAEFATTRLVPPAEATLSGDWEVKPPVNQGRYRHGTINARRPGDALEYTFIGTAVALFLDVQRDGGKFSWSIDASKDTHDADPSRGGVVDTAPGPFFPRNHYATLTHGLPPGRHVLRIKVLPEHDPTSSGNRLLIGYIMVAGASEP